MLQLSACLSFNLKGFWTVDKLSENYKKIHKRSLVFPLNLVMSPSKPAATVQTQPVICNTSVMLQQLAEIM